MLTKDEIIRRAKRLMQLPADQRPIKPYTFGVIAGTGDNTPLLTVIRHESMGPDMQRRMSKAFEHLENDQIPDVDTLPKGANRYKKLKLNREKQPPCQPVMLLDVSRGTPRLVTAFHNPLALPETLFNKVKR